MTNEVLQYSQMPGPNDLLFSRDLSGDIDMGAYQRGDGSFVTTAASTCIVLAAHNDESKQGLLGHFSSISDEEEEGYWDGEVFREAVSEIPSLGDPLATSVWLGGGMPNPENGRDSVVADRAHAETMVRRLINDFRLCGGQINARWSAPERVIDVELDCPTGILVAHDYPQSSKHTVADMLIRLASLY